MEAWLRSLSKSTIAFLAIAGGILLIVLVQPPHTVCDSQIELIEASQKNFLYKNPKSKVAKTTPYQVLRDRCKATNDPGGCYELFQRLRALLDHLTTLTEECHSAGGSISEVKQALWESAELMVKLAWGEKPPASYYTKFSWLDKADMALFCKLKLRLGQFYGESTVDQFRERMMKELPGAKDLSREQVWELSLFSENCSRYP